MAFNGWFAGLILSSCLGVFCVFSDHLPLVQQKSNYVRSAVIDSVIHFVIGAWCWFVVCDKRFIPALPEIVIGGVLSSAIDIDHFLAAQSLSLKGALSLRHRPLLHAVISIPCAAGLCWLFQSFVRSTWSSKIVGTQYYVVLVNLHSIVVVAWSSHQLRDSIRRGLWFWPLGSLPPTPYWIYISTMVIVPQFLRFFVRKGYLLEQEAVSEDAPV